MVCNNPVPVRREDGGAIFKGNHFNLIFYCFDSFNGHILLLLGSVFPVFSAARNPTVVSEPWFR